MTENQTPGTTNPSELTGEVQVSSNKIIVLQLQSVRVEKDKDGGSAIQAETQKLFRFNKSRVVVGSVVSSDVRLAGSGISPIHAVIEIARNRDSGIEEATIYDLASESGVFVNEKPAVTQVLKPGDQIVIGWYQFRFGIEDSATMTDAVSALREGRKLFVNPVEDFSSLMLEDERDVKEIFDYRPTAKPALEVVMSWSDTILEVEHFVREKTVTIGQTRRSDFGIPPLLSMRAYAIISRVGRSFVLNLDPQMKGVIQKAGRLQDFDQIRQERAATNPGGPIQIPIEKDEFAKVTLGEIDFYLSYTAAPPRLKRNATLEPDPLFYKIFGTSMVLTALIVSALMSAHMPETLEPEEVPDRIATILYQPEKYPEAPKAAEPISHEAAVTPPTPKVEPKPQPTTKVAITPHEHLNKPAPKFMDTAHETPKKHGRPTKVAQNGGAHSEHQAKEGQGAKAKGNEGTRGQKNAAPSKAHQDLAARPSPEAGKGSGGAPSQVPDIGNMEALKGATSTFENLLGASGQKLGKAGERLKGFGGFTSQGDGGLALSGNGKGGGGDAAALGGLGKNGRGGGRVGTGMGAAGNGSGIAGGQSRVVIQSGGPEETVVMGAIDADAVEAALLAHRDEFRLCYEREINAEQPKISGRVGTNFVIGSSGKVGQAGIESSTLGSPNVERCILSVIKRIQFPIPRGGGVVQVSYPFKFNAVGS